MKTKITMLLALLVLVSLSVFVSAYFAPSYDESTNKITYNIQRAGWYLVPLGFNLDGCQREMIGENEWRNTGLVKAGWVWSPTLKKYLGGKDFNRFEGTQAELQQFEDDRNSKYLYAAPKLGGAWVYIAGECEIGDYLGAGSLDDPALREAFSQYRLAKGWNFFTITPSYLGKSLNEIKGNCEIVRMAEWDADSQSWITSGWEEELDGPITNVGKVLVIKVSETCNLGLESSGSGQPPALPE